MRLEIETGADPEIVERLRVNFELDEDQVFRGDGPVNLSRLMFFYSDIQRPDLKFSAFRAKSPSISAASQPTSLTNSASTTSFSTIPTTPTIR